MASESKIGYPTREYRIPYDNSASLDLHTEWYLILTSNNYHFYFNRLLKQSYWQLADIAAEFKDVDIEEFVLAINFDVISLMFARNVGLKGLDGYYFEKQDADQDTIEVEEFEEEEEEIRESDTGDAEEVEIDVEARDGMIREFLLEEGYEVKEEKAEDEVKEEPKAPTGISLVSGYSSSEEEDDESGEEKPAEKGSNSVEKNDHHDISQDKEEQVEEVDDLQSDESDSENSGLDLNISEDEDGSERLQTSAVTEFIELLDMFADRIDKYQPWDLIEEELLPDFVKHPQYYALEHASQREEAFDEWLKSRSQKEDNSSEKEVTQEPPLYPTPTLDFYHFLQDHKKELKSATYQEFYNKNHEHINDVDLVSKEKEALFRKFKIMLQDQTEFEKSAKKSKALSPGINLKRYKLDEFLSTQESVEIHPGQLQEITNSGSTDYGKWLALANKLNLRKELIESTKNFIVGDEKRLAAYLDKFSSN